MTRAYMFACALLLMAGAAHAQTASLGRLFSTPDERHQLDVARGLATAPPAPPVAAPQAAPIAPAPEPVTINGFVRRSAGRSTVWVNQETRDARQNQFSGPAQAPQVTLNLPGGGKVKVKPGQTVDLSTGTVRDVDAP